MSRARLSFLHIAPTLVALWAATVTWSSVGADGHDVLINLTISTPGDVNIYKSFQTNEENLKRFNLTAEDMSEGNVHLNSHGEVDEIEVKGMKIPLHLDLRKEIEGLTYSYLTVDKKTWSVRVGDFNNVTLDDFKDDPNLVPENMTLDWSLIPAYTPNPANISLKSGVMEASIHFNNDTLLFEYLEGEVKVGKWVPILPYTGLFLRVINPHTRQLTFSKYFSTDYFMDKEFLENIRNLKKGRIAIVASFYDVTGHFETPVRDALEECGSFAAQHLRFRDLWAWVWQVGGATLAEGLVTNQNGIETIPPPLYLSLQIPAVNASERFCEDWPTGGTWEKRKQFCDTYDGYGDLCSCDNPFPTTADNPKMDTWREDIGILLVTGNRPQYLYRLLRQVLLQPGVNKTQIFVSIDGFHEEPVKLVEIFELKYLIHHPVGVGSPRISRHLRFALFKGLKELDTDKFIVLEDDLLLSPDFYSYMQQTSAILDTDSTVYGVSAYAHFSYNHTAKDATRLNRVHSFPAYGWMVRRRFVEETLPKWPPEFVAVDWDYWMGTGLVRRGRELIIPEIPRTVHAGLTGAHVNGYLTKRRFSNKPVSTDPNARVNITGLRKEIYEREILDLVNEAELLNITNPYNYTFPRTPGKVYAIFIKMTHEEDDGALKIIADALSVWNQDARDHHYGLWRIPYYDAMMLIIGYPFSKYRKYYKKGYNVIRATSERLDHLSDNFNDESFVYKSHRKSDYINIMGLFDIPKAKGVNQKTGNERSLTNQEFLTTSSQFQNISKLHPVTEMQENLKKQEKETIHIINRNMNESESTIIQDSTTSASIQDVTEGMKLGSEIISDGIHNSDDSDLGTMGVLGNSSLSETATMKNDIVKLQN